MKRLIFIYNPHAGKGKIKEDLSDILDIFVKGGFTVEVYPTQRERDGMRKVLSLPEGVYDQVVVSGGDGTLDEIVTGMMEREEKIPIGYIPTGSTNDFASSLHISDDALEAAVTAVNGFPFPCDMGGFNDDSFVYIAAFGLFTDVSYQTPQEAKKVLGHLAYILEGTKRLANIPSYRMRITCDDRVIEDAFMYGMVTNSKSVGGFRNMIGKGVVFDDGVFEVMLIKSPKNIREFNEIIASLVAGQTNTKYMYAFKTGKIFFESEESIPWTLDGEFGGDHRQVDIENRERALKICVDEAAIPYISGNPGVFIKNID